MVRLKSRELEDVRTKLFRQKEGGGQQMGPSLSCLRRLEQGECRRQ